LLVSYLSVVRHDSAPPANGVECIAIAECLGFNLGKAFEHLWHGGLDARDPRHDYEQALWFLKRYDQQATPLPRLRWVDFRERTGHYRRVFDRPSPWCEPIRYALVAICNIAATDSVVEQSRLTLQAIRCIETALSDLNCMGRGMEP
jgi:hypothetical protein